MGRLRRRAAVWRLRGCVLWLVAASVVWQWRRWRIWVLLLLLLARFSFLLFLFGSSLLVRFVAVTTGLLACSGLAGRCSGGMSDGPVGDRAVEGRTCTVVVEGTFACAASKRRLQRLHSRYFALSSCRFAMTRTLGTEEEA